MGKAISIITDDLETCFVCGRMASDIHHCIHGHGRRDLAQKYHLVIGVCNECHSNIHDRDTALDRRLQQLAQKKFEEHYDLNFREIFGKNYR